MPLYEYRCNTCGGAEEKLEGISAPSQHDCSLCGIADGMQRQISVAAFSLSGDGWYSQGYGTKKAAEPPKEASSPAPTGCCGGVCPHKQGS